MSSVRQRLCALFAAVALVVAAGCATSESAPDGEDLKPGQGLLVMKLDSNTSARLNYQEFSAETNFGSRFAENMFGAKGVIFFRPGAKYWVLPVDAGDYMWSKIEISNLFANLHSSNRFRVKPNTITYIGDIRVAMNDRRIRFFVTNGEPAIRQYLNEQYPVYMRSMQFETILAELRL